MNRGTAVFTVVRDRRCTEILPQVQMYSQRRMPGGPEVQLLRITHLQVEASSPD